MHNACWCSAMSYVNPTKRAVWRLLDADPDLSNIQLAALLGKPVSTVAYYAAPWRQRQLEREHEAGVRCPSCEFYYSADNPRVAEGVCLACYCVQHGIDQWRLFEQGAMTAMVALASQ